MTFYLQSQFQRFLYQDLCVFSQKKKIENIFNGIFILSPVSVLGSKTLAWGFAIMPHRLRVLVPYCFQKLIMLTVLTYSHR